VVVCGLNRGGSRGCPGCPDTRPFDYGALFEKNIFSIYMFLAEQGASLFVKTKKELNHRFPIYAF